MAGITIDQAQTALNQALAAQAAVMGGQSFELNGRRVTRANLKEIQDNIILWNKMVMELSRSGPARTIRQISVKD